MDRIDDAQLYALGLLEAVERDRIDEHVRTCDLGAQAIYEGHGRWLQIVAERPADWRAILVEENLKGTVIRAGRRRRTRDMNIRLAAATIAAAFVVSGQVPARAADAPKPAIVHIKNFMFIPANLTVPAGTTVTFVNDDDEPHTVTATNKTFDSEALDTHGSWKHTFAKAGSFTYFCELHPYMKGSLVVRSGGNTR
jgi:plastocyanin